MSSNGCARPSPPIPSPCCTASPRIAGTAGCSARISTSTSPPMTKPTRGSVRTGSPLPSAPPAGWGWWRWWACSPTSFPARWTSRASCGRRASRFASADFMSPAASPCCRNCRPIFARRRRWASRCSPGRRSSGWMRCCGTPPRGRCSRCMISWTICRAWKARPCRSCRPSGSSGRPGGFRASMPGAAVRSSVRSAPSSTCRAASRATVRPTTSRRSCAATSPRGWSGSSSPTTTWRATATGKCCSTG